MHRLGKAREVEVSYTLKNLGIFGSQFAYEKEYIA